MHYDLPFIGDLLLKADLAIGAPGSSSYERCLAQTPTLCICIAENQKSVIDPLVQANVIKYLGSIENNYQEKLIYYLDFLNTHIMEIELMNNNCQAFINLEKNLVRYIIT